jgi:hypothetical protein
MLLNIMICQQCKIELDTPVNEVPARHACSPERARFSVAFCSKNCAGVWQKQNYAYWAELDLNASDSECFVHERWLNEYRIGKCSVTGDEVKVQPMQPHYKSGQPQQCTEHFKLHERYSSLITN